jgi:hypothetical protein
MENSSNNVFVNRVKTYLLSPFYCCHCGDKSLFSINYYNAFFVLFILALLANFIE